MFLSNLVRAGLKTIVVMAGGCALQASPHFVQPQTGGLTTTTSPSLAAGHAEASSEHESRFHHPARLCRILTNGAETEPRDHVGGVHNGQVSAEEECVFAISRSYGE